MKQTQEKTVQANKDLVTELQGLNEIEMNIQQRAKESQTKMMLCEEQNEMEQNVPTNVGMKTAKSIDYNGTSDDSGIMTMNDDSSKIQNEATNVSFHEQTLDQTMFEERQSPKKNQVLKTPTKEQSSVGPMHSTPRSSASSITRFLKPKSNHCSAPPNLTPIPSLSLGTSPKMFTPRNSFNRVETKSTIGKLSTGVLRTTPLKNTITSMKASENPTTPTKNEFNMNGPVTTTLNNSRFMPPITPAKKNSAVHVMPMNQGLLAPTPEKQPSLEIIPVKHKVTWTSMIQQSH
jgi:hypothetical protein